MAVMMRRTTAVIVCATVGAAVLVGLTAHRSEGDDAQAPGVFPAEECGVAIVGQAFVRELTAEDAQFTESQADKYRGLILTLKITKPADLPLTLHAQDLPLHYRYGESYDVTTCMGLSAFSTIANTERAMQLSSSSYVKSTTGAATTQAETVYVDAFYQYMEPTVSELEVLVARPVGAQAKSGGWRQ